MIISIITATTTTTIRTYIISYASDQENFRIRRQCLFMTQAANYFLSHPTNLERQTLLRSDYEQPNSTVLWGIRRQSTAPVRWRYRVVLLDDIE